MNVMTPSISLPLTIVTIFHNNEIRKVNTYSNNLYKQAQVELFLTLTTRIISRFDKKLGRIFVKGRAL